MTHIRHAAAALGVLTVLAMTGTAGAQTYPMPQAVDAETLIARQSLALTPAQRASAQPAAVDGGAIPSLGLSTEQKQAIYQSVSTTQKNNAAPNGFRIALGTRVPDGIELKQMPKTIGALIPAIDAMDVAMIEKQVVIVDPKSKTILEILTQ